MLTARRAIILFSGLAILSVGAAVYNLTKPPDSEGLGRDSYGTRAHGHRAVFQTLEELKFPAHRSLIPPPTTLKEGQSLVMIAPSEHLVDTEPAYLNQTREWIKSGGRALVALPSGYSHQTCDTSCTVCEQKTTLLRGLGVTSATVVQIAVNDNALISTATADLETGRKDREEFAGIRVNEERDTGIFRVRSNDTAAGLADVKRLHMPYSELQVVENSTSTTVMTPLVQVTSEDDVDYTLVAKYPMGEGELVVITDDALFYNYLFALEDNPVLAVNLLVGMGDSAVFDEFYHGLNVRGNPLWLLTQPGYAFVLLATLLAIGLWIWRQAITAGPPLPEKAARRRTLTEYLNAISVLFSRTHQRKYVLKELHRGVLWSLRQELHLPPGSENVETISAALERHEPHRAHHLRKVSKTIDDLIADKHELHRTTLTEVAQEINKCL